MVTLAGSQLIDILYPNASLRSGTILTVLGPMMFFYFLNFLLIPRWGVLSSAGVRVAMELGMSAAFVWLIRRNLGPSFRSRTDAAGEFTANA